MVIQGQGITDAQQSLQALGQAAEGKPAAKVDDDVGKRLHLQCMSFSTGLQAGSSVLLELGKLWHDAVKRSMAV